MSVERIMEYFHLEQEDNEVTIEAEQPWPRQGKIEFRNFSTRYRPDLDLSLKRLTLVIKGGEKIGIRGRTGAGKSSVSKVCEAVKSSLVSPPIMS